MSTNELDQIEIEINNLQQRKREILDNQNKELILSLEWIKDCEATLKIDPFFAAGIPKYKILLTGRVPKYNSTLIIIKGQNYLEDIVYQDNFLCDQLFKRSYCLTTYSEQSLINFLSSVRFKSFSFPNSDLKLFNFLEEYKKTYEQN